MLACGIDPKVGHGRADRPRRRHLARARAARCTCSRSSMDSTAATASSARRSRSAPALASRTNTRTTAALAVTYFGDGAVEPGPGLRKLQHGRAVEAAGDLRHREQPICDGHQRQPLVGRGPALPPRRKLPHPRPAGRRHGRAARCAARPNVAVEWVRARQGADPARDEDLSLSRPFDVRPGEISQRARRSQAVREKSDPIEHAKRDCSSGRGRRGRAQGDRQGDPRDRRRSRRLRREAPEPDANELYTDVLVGSY